jgi:hypothetical protein
MTPIRQVLPAFSHGRDCLITRQRDIEIAHIEREAEGLHRLNGKCRAIPATHVDGPIFEGLIQDRCEGFSSLHSDFDSEREA